MEPAHAVRRGCGRPVGTAVRVGVRWDDHRKRARAPPPAADGQLSAAGARASVVGVLGARGRRARARSRAAPRRGARLDLLAHVAGHLPRARGPLGGRNTHRALAARPGVRTVRHQAGPGDGPRGARGNLCRGRFAGRATAVLRDLPAPHADPDRPPARHRVPRARHVPDPLPDVPRVLPGPAARTRRYGTGVVLRGDRRGRDDRARRLRAIRGGRVP